MIACDICIIGAGSGGLSIAAAAAQLGRKVVLVEKGKMGGDCLNSGCVPSKALIAAAKRAHDMRNGAAFGIDPVEPKITFKAVHDHVHGVIAAIAPNDSVERFEKLGVKVIKAEARFEDRETVVAGGETIRARRFAVATGSTAAVPSIPGLAEIPYLTNESVFDLTALPKHLVIIGGGPIGLELAQAFRRLGSRVTVLEALEPLGKEDPELAAPVLKALASEGVDVRAKTAVARVHKAQGGVVIETASGNVSGSHLLVATGRKPTVEGLDLDAAGIAHSAKGIEVDAGLRTSNRKVYAIGDVTGAPMFTHMANYHAGLVVRNALFRLPVRARHGGFPRVTFTDPELAQTGLTEAEARAKHGAITVLRSPFHDNDRAQTERRAEGLVKAIIGPRGRILGAGIVSPHAGELIQPWILAMNAGLSVKALVDMTVPYPVFGDANKRAALGYYSALASKPWVRRVIDLLSRFG
jgi:pyruvate/2-oxoglutarate dehydrogenase complex dihydrolipoamide dehydrogenase (E3) component